MPMRHRRLRQRPDVPALVNPQQPPFRRFPEADRLLYGFEHATPNAEMVAAYPSLYR